MKTRKSNILGEQVMLEGLMTFGKLKTGQRTLDFECCEDVAAEAFNGRYYFVFSLDEDEVRLLPQKLMDQASAIARKVIRELMKGGYSL